MHEERDRRDRDLLAAGDHATLLASYFLQIHDRLMVWLPADDADEVLQRTLLRLASELAQGKSYEVPFRVVAWQVTGWTVKDFYRESRRRPSSLPQEWDPADPHDPLRAVEDEDWVAWVVDRLPPRDREIALLRYCEGLEIAEIAERCGIRRNAVDQALFRVRRAVREKLTHETIHG